jgi:hypothetical protein
LRDAGIIAILSMNHGLLTICFMKNISEKLSVHARRTVFAATVGLLGLVLHLTVVPVRADFIALPLWSLYGGGNGATWNGSSTSPDNAQLSVTLSPPPIPFQYGTAVAASSADVVKIAPAATYALTFSAMVTGPGSAAAVMVDTNSTIAEVSISGSTWTRYTNAFTTASNDPRVGRSLNIQLLVNQNGTIGTSSVSFTNIQLQLLQPQPVLQCRIAGQNAVQISWPTNFPSYIPQQRTNLQAGTWQDLGIAPVPIGDQLVIQMNVDTARRFFRLRAP